MWRYFLEIMLSFKPTWPFLWIILVLSMLLLICGSSIKIFGQLLLGQFLSQSGFNRLYSAGRQYQFEKQSGFNAHRPCFTAFNFAQILEPILLGSLSPTYLSSPAPPG